MKLPDHLGAGIVLRFLDFGGLLACGGSNPLARNFIKRGL
jgi:hypothetical protein